MRETASQRLSKRAQEWAGERAFVHHVPLRGFYVRFRASATSPAQDWFIGYNEAIASKALSKKVITD